MDKRFPVTLTDPDRDQWKRLLAVGPDPAHKLPRARLWLQADQGSDGLAWTDQAIADAVEVSQPTVARIHRQSGQRAGRRP